MATSRMPVKSYCVFKLSFAFEASESEEGTDLVETLKSLIYVFSFSSTLVSPFIN